MKMLRVSLSLLFLSLFALSMGACSGGSGGGGGGDGDGIDPGGGTFPTPTPTATPTPVTEAPPVIGTTPGLCEYGDVGLLQFDDTGKARFSLNPDSIDCTGSTPGTKDSRKEEYTLIIFNTLGSAQSFDIQGPIDSTIEDTSDTSARIGLRTDGSLTSPTSSKNVQLGPDSMTNAAAETYREARESKEPLRYTGESPIYQATSADFSVGDEAEFRVRCDREDPDTFCVTSARLRARGSRINIFTDRDMPYRDTEAECELVDRAADCLSGEQLERIVQIYGNNTYPLATKLMGQPSDVDGDERVNVVITPIVNKFLVAESYTDPRNLLPFNADTNAGSNESEVIFVFAPDSLDYYRGDADANPFRVPADNYVSKSLNAWIAFQFSKIINFNQHVFINGAPAEDDWIADGIGTLIADLAGFNIWRRAAWLYLTSPQLDDLRESEDLDDRDFEGNEYLFMTYFMQAAVNGSVSDSDGDGFDDDLDFLNELVNSELTGVENLEAVVEYAFDEDSETEFQSIFKDWTIALAASGTNRQDLQQDTDALNYYLGLNGIPVTGGAASRFGTGIANTTGSTRVGADGGSLDYDLSGNPDANRNIVGIDLNLYHSEENLLIENADEHVWAPGNRLYGYVDPFSAMFVRIGGMFQENQVLTVRVSSPSIQGYLLRRSNITYPKVYSESRFLTLDQYPEDLDNGNENPYWVSQGNAKAIDFQSHIGQTADGEVAPDFLSVIGRIDEPGTRFICPEEVESLPADCTEEAVPDVDKYIFTVPDLGLGTNAANGFHDEGFLAISVRRQFDDGVDTSDLAPILAVVSSKDVPYPYAQHPMRGSATHTSRQQYRWLIPTFPCGDDDSGESTTATANCAANPADPLDTEATNVITPVGDGGVFEPNAGDVAGYGGTVQGLFDVLPRGLDNDITGGECNSESSAPGSSSAGYNGDFGVSVVENSPSSLGAYPSWGPSFMLSDWEVGYFPELLYDREILTPVSGYPPILVSQDVVWDPRALATFSQNCQVATSGDPNTVDDSPDDLVSPSELYQPTSMAEQILAEMARGRSLPSGEEVNFAGNPDPQSLTGNLPAELLDYDMLSIDSDSRDDDTDCEIVDFGNNTHANTVRAEEGSILWGNYSSLVPQIAFNTHNSDYSDDSQTLYFPHPDTGGFSPYVGDETAGEIILTPGKSYTIIVAGKDETEGRYELRIRKVARDRLNGGIGYIVEPGEDEICYLIGP